MDVVIGQQADLGAPPIWVESILRRLGGGIVVGEESVYEDPATGGGGLRSLRMKRPHVVKPAGVGLWWSSVGVSCLRGRTLPQHRRAHRQASLHWRKINFVSYNVVQNGLMPSPECQAREMRNEKADKEVTHTNAVFSQLSLSLPSS